jgi:hypothetical protein
VSDEERLSHGVRPAARALQDPDAEFVRRVHEFDVTSDGQRFLVSMRIGKPTTPPPVVVTNWMRDLKK